MLQKKFQLSRQVTNLNVLRTRAILAVQRPGEGLWRLNGDAGDMAEDDAAGGERLYQALAWIDS